MKWRNPMQTRCPTCGRTSLLPVAVLRSLQAVCPLCGGLLAAFGAWLLAEEARLRPVIDRAIADVWAELEAEEAEKARHAAAPAPIDGGV